MSRTSSDPLVGTMFGYGVLTWTIPYLFRTDPGWNLLARGPANLPQDGVSALEGLVETDWATATFTMNWKMTRPGLPVRFEAGEPFCQIVPQRRHELEAFRPQKASLTDEQRARAAVPPVGAKPRRADDPQVREPVRRGRRLRPAELAEGLLQGPDRRTASRLPTTRPSGACVHSSPLRAAPRRAAGDQSRRRWTSCARLSRHDAAALGRSRKYPSRRRV